MPDPVAMNLIIKLARQRRLNALTLMLYARRIRAPPAERLKVWPSSPSPLLSRVCEEVCRLRFHISLGTARLVPVSSYLEVLARSW